MSSGRRFPTWQADRQTAVRVTAVWQFAHHCLQRASSGAGPVITWQDLPTVVISHRRCFQSRGSPFFPLRSTPLSSSYNTASWDSYQRFLQELPDGCFRIGGVWSQRWHQLRFQWVVAAILGLTQTWNFILLLTNHPSTVASLIYNLNNNLTGLHWLVWTSHDSPGASWVLWEETPPKRTFDWGRQQNWSLFENQPEEAQRPPHAGWQQDRAAPSLTVETLHTIRNDRGLLLPRQPRAG